MTEISSPIACQRAGCDAFADMKVREFISGGKTIRWWYLCVVHVEEDFGPWLAAKRSRR